MFRRRGITNGCGNLLVHRHLNPESASVKPGVHRRAFAAPALGSNRMRVRESTIDIAIVFHSADNAVALCVRCISL